ncbi:dihydrofolate reductase [Paenibacillaceae bacterium WGS1546]|uniref:dihydrofolate reductase n=1 Tax=Cohnella sp. WGS1546 TaxID=3366810 RepID=UPI00372CF3C8
MTVTLIAAVAANGVIGRDNELLWRLPADMRYFRRHTLGKTVMMGRKTFESLGRPLKDRKNVVLSRTLAEAPDGCELVRSIPEALERFGNDGELMVIGGAEIYRQALPFADRLRLTELGRAYEGDACFPEFDRNEWRLASREEGALDEKNVIPHVYCVYERQIVE